MSSSKARARPPAIEPPSPLMATSTVQAVSSNTTEMLIFIKDEVNEVNNLAKVLSEITLYTTRNSQMTPHWSMAATAQCNSSPVKAIGTRIRYHLKPTAWVVFIGIVPGVYYRWVKGKRGSAGYPDPTDPNPRRVRVRVRNC